MADIQVLTGADFDVAIGKGVVLVDFFAEWCGPCKMLSPILADVAKAMDGKVVVGKVDIDQESDIAMKFQVMSVPTLIIFKNGQEVRRVVGLKDKDSLVTLIRSVL